MPSPSFYSAKMTVEAPGQEAQEFQLKSVKDGQVWYRLIYALAQAVEALRELGKDFNWLAKHVEAGTVITVEADGKLYQVNFGEFTAQVVTRPRGGGGRTRKEKVIIEL